MPEERVLGAIVLAGGRSSRMRASKAMLDWHGAPLLRRVTGILQRVADPVVVVHAAGQRLPPLPGVRLVADGRPGRGPLEGIAAGMRELAGSCNAVFVSSTDVPLLHPSFVRGVAASLDGHDVALPVADGHEHPLGAAYRLSLLPQVEQLLAADRLRTGFLLEGSRVRRLGRDELVEPQSLRNLNTPQEYAAALGEPQPEISLEAHGALRTRLGFSSRRVRAATLATAIRNTPGLADVLAQVVIALNGERLQADPSTPLVDGDVLAVTVAEAAA
jgi:molybdopterin-guanine dinucleotide biosynthesis protein A